MNSRFNNREICTRKPLRRNSITITIIIAHVLAILGPLAFIMLNNKLNPKTSTFKIKLMGEPSTGENVGAPRRLPPSPNPPAPTPPTPSVVKPVIVKPVIKRPVVTKPVVKKVKPKPKVKPKTVKPKEKTKRVTPKAKPKSQKTNMKKLQNDVYRPPSGSNNNSNVPIGNRNVYQNYGKRNSNTIGSSGFDSKRYGKQLGDFLKLRWTIPPRSLLGSGNIEVLISLTIAPNGRVLRASILRRSGNKAMDVSVARMLHSLKQVPKPPGNKQVTLDVRMLPDM